LCAAALCWKQAPVFLGAWRVARLLLMLGFLVAWAAPARADDISAAGRGVVRVVTVAVVDDEVVGFGHGSGFAVGPDRIVTNAHVVELAGRYAGNVVIGIVPSEGDKSYQGRLIAVDEDRDLALIEVQGLKLPPLALYNGPIGEGEATIALGYPGNVDLATAQSASDYILPLSPVRSEGVFSGLRRLGTTGVLLHTANIARGNSGGPLLDRCGRVLGVNSALTRGDDGDASFGFAIAGSEVSGFLREAGQQATMVGTNCISMEELLAQDRAAAADAAQQDAARARVAAERAAAERATALESARERNEATRENYMAGAAVLLVLAGLAAGGAGLMATRGKRREAIWVGAGGGVLLVGAVVLFLVRPSFDPASVPETSKPASAANGLTGKLLCRLVPERSRVTVSATPEVAMDWQANGCMNGRTQYAEAPNQGWERILVPDEEQTVSVLRYEPATGTYINTRYLLGADRMTEARRLREGVALKQCAGESAGRANLATQQAAIRTSLPPLPNERLVYHCQPARGTN
jgi:S1-C subfamily serine protease